MVLFFSFKERRFFVEKFLVVAHFGGKSYADGGIALVQDSDNESGQKEIIVVGPWSGPGPRYIVEKWPSNTYDGIVKNGQRLDLPDSVWNAVMRLQDIEKSDSVSERDRIVKDFEKAIGVDLVVEMHLAGAF